MDVSEIVVCYVFPSFRNSFVQCKAPVIFFFYYNKLYNLFKFMFFCFFEYLSDNVGTETPPRFMYELESEFVCVFLKKS